MVLMKVETKYFLMILAWIGYSSLVVSCNDGSEAFADEVEVFVPAPPDYEDPEMWVRYDNDSTGEGADVFYIPSTWEYDWIAADGRVSHWADPSLTAHRSDMKIEIDGVADYMADGNNFVSPFYRHITLDSWATLNEDTINRRYHDVAFQDVKEAFGRFSESLPPEQPFILAGFSQGGKSVVELLKIMSPELRDRMVAAYVMGYKVTPDDIEAAPWIKDAQRDTDTGVTICYNSVSALEYVKPIVSEPCVMCINPVSWTVTSDPAFLDDSITVTLVPERNVLVVEGYDGSTLPNILDILNTGDYHGAEPWLYSECLRRNFKDRIRTFRKK